LPAFALCRLSRLLQANSLQERPLNIARTRKLKRRHHQTKPLHRLRLLRRLRLHQRPSAVAKKPRLAQQRVRLHRLTRACSRAQKQKADAKKTETGTSASPSPAKFSLGDLFKPKSSAAASPAAVNGAAAKNTSGAATATAPAPGGGHGLVWVNTDSHVYHKEGSRFYGTTKKGKYMTESEAVKEGNRAAGKGE